MSTSAKTLTSLVLAERFDGLRGHFLVQMHRVSATNRTTTMADAEAMAAISLIPKPPSPLLPLLLVLPLEVPGPVSVS